MALNLKIPDTGWTKLMFFKKNLKNIYNLYTFKNMWNKYFELRQFHVDLNLVDWCLTKNIYRGPLLDQLSWCFLWKFVQTIFPQQRNEKNILNLKHLQIQSNPYSSSCSVTNVSLRYINAQFWSQFCMVLKNKCEYKSWQLRGGL